MDDETTGRYRDGETFTSAHPVKFEFQKNEQPLYFLQPFQKSTMLV